MEEAGFGEQGPRISVVIPTFERADWVVEAVRSVQAQSFADWEAIVVDDGSTDETVGRLEALGEPRLKLIRRPHEGQVARLRNIGATAARGDYLAFLDSDDLWRPDKLALQLDALAGRGDAWCYGAHQLIDEAGSPRPLRAGRFVPLSGKIAAALVRDETGASITTWLVPRALFERLRGFDESLGLREDLDLALRLAEAADAVALGETLAFTREHDRRKTRGQSDPHHRMAIVFAKTARRTKEPAVRNLARRRAAGHLVAAGGQAIEAGRIAEGLGFIGRAIAGGAGFGVAMRALAGGFKRRLKRLPG